MSFSSVSPHVSIEVGRSDLLISRGDLAARFRFVRGFTELLTEPLETEDFIIQTMPDISPTKWHIAHTTWFFEAFVLGRVLPNYKPVSDDYYYLFNSYYNSLGERHCRPRRGLLSRPTVREVMDYRRIVEERVFCMIDSVSDAEFAAICPMMILGLNHEQQHQELMLTDLLHVFSANPMRPSYHKRPAPPTQSAGVPLQFTPFKGGLFEVGYGDENRFSFDNESPRHRVYLNPFSIANRPVTCREYLPFVEEGGYENPMLWLSDGWSALQQEKWDCPFYWRKTDEGWKMMTLFGELDLDLNAPVSHLSYYEADAFARWAGARLPKEEEWEVACGGLPMEGNFAESNRFHPKAAQEGEGILQAFGDVWEWTASSYHPYPGFKPAEGAAGEYNGKFMCNQFVLRGGSCATSQSHMRSTYRNFFHPGARWQFSGIRLAKDGGGD